MAGMLVRQQIFEKEVFYMEGSIIGDWIYIYAFASGVLCWPFMRPPFARWYKSQTWVVSGANPIEIFFKQIGFWLMFEGFVFCVACIIGALGGWFFVLVKGLFAVPVEKSSDDSLEE